MNGNAKWLKVIAVLVGFILLEMTVIAVSYHQGETQTERRLHVLEQFMNGQQIFNNGLVKTFGVKPPDGLIK